MIINNFADINDYLDRDIAFLKLGDTLESAIFILKKTKMDSLPVTTATKELIGLFTKTNLYNALLQRTSLDDAIDPWITKDVFSISEHTSNETIEKITMKSPVGSCPVLDEEDRVVGLITKPKMVLTLFKKSNLLNAKLTAILDAMHNGVVTFDKNASITLINKSAEKMFGLNGQKYLGLPCNSVLTGLDLHSVIEQGEAKIGIKYVRGRMVTIVNIMPITDDSSVNGVVAVFQDLTELKQAASELEDIKNLNQTLDTVINSIYDGIIVVDERGHVTLINKTLTDFLKIRPEEALNKHITKLMANSRLHIVARSGAPEFSEVQNIGDNEFIVSRVPILKDGMPAGAVGKVVFPQLPEIQELVRKLNTLQSKVTYYEEELKAKQSEMKNIIGTSPIMLHLKDEIRRISRSNSTILVTGESGTGKELVAQAIHFNSQWRDGPYIRINCAAIPENLLESEIFGYAPGAFSGANRNGKPGRFELADKGTIFFDEIGDMSLTLQAKLLRVIQEREFERVGGTKPIHVDVRIISATNRDLRKAVADGTFREDLYYRFNVINLHLPPLRERKEDIETLIAAFLEKFNRILKTEITGISPNVHNIFLGYSWPGNVRELENVIERAANYLVKGEILSEHLPSYLSTFENTSTLKEVETPDMYRNTLHNAEKDIILSALDKSGGNRSNAAKLLNMSRTRFYSRLKKLGLN